MMTPLASPSPQMNTFGGKTAGICEGVKQILLLSGNKKIFFHPRWGENVLHTFTKWFFGAIERNAAVKKQRKMAFFAQKVPFVNNCELYKYTVYYY
jgi:hypothetical protein